MKGNASEKHVEDNVPVDRQIFRYWIELRDLRDGTTRDLPLTCFRVIPLPTKRGAPDLPSRIELHVQDVSRTWVANDVDGLSTQLRGEYPDGTFERRLKYERDLEAEHRRHAAMDKLVRIVARAAFDRYLRERSE